MREHVRQFIVNAQSNGPVDLGAEAVRLAQVAAAIHTAEAAQAIAELELADVPGTLQEQYP